jgi:HSP20 family protein
MVHRDLLTKRQWPSEHEFSNNSLEELNIMHCKQTKNRIATPFGDFQVDVENLFDHFFGDQQVNPQGRWLPRTNISESDTSYHVSIELAGVSPADVNVEMHDGVLEVSGKRDKVNLPEGVKALKVEQRSGEFRRKFEFPTVVDADRIEAAYENGVLSVELPKSEKVLPRKIDIKVGE